MTLIFDTSIKSIGSVSCTHDISNSTPVYVVDGSDAVLQCGFESSNLNWDVFYGVGWDIIAYNSVTIDNSKYSTSKNPSTGLYYILHILNVEVSELKKHK
jgi:hypothetical protein